MKKIMIGVSLLLSGLFAGDVMAQTPAACQAQTQTKCETRQCDAKVRPGQACANLFEGMNLTAEQQSQLKALTPCNSNKKREDRKERREAAQTARKEYLAKVKSILTPEQYVQFLENSYLNMAPRHGGDRVKMERRK